MNDRGHVGLAVECTGLWKSFGAVQALRSTDLSLETGSLTAVLGPSGCGKTTLLRAIAGFERLDGGRIHVSGQAVAGPGLHVPPERRRVTIVPQEQALFPHLTVAGNVGYGVKRGARRDKAVETMLALAGLSGLGDRMPHELSGGQQQRVALARALAPEPSVVLLDEPFGSLDAALRDEIRSEVAAVLRASGATSLLVTHDQEEALSMADSVAVMRSGVIVQHGPPNDVYRRPADLWVANFVGRANILAGRISSPGTVETALGTLVLVGGPDTVPDDRVPDDTVPDDRVPDDTVPDDRVPDDTVPDDRVPDDRVVDVVVRPEQLQVVATADGADLAVVEDRRYFGHDVVIGVCLATGERLLVRLPSAEPMPVGSRVTVSCREPVLAFPTLDDVP